LNKDERQNLILVDLKKAVDAGVDAGAVVTKSTKPFSIVAGVPAKKEQGLKG